jgi:hypothetical protein
MASSFLVFLVYANATGVELFMNSTRSMNATVTVYLFVMVGFLEYWLGLSPLNFRALAFAAAPVPGRGG